MAGGCCAGGGSFHLLYTGLPPNATTEQLHNSRMVRWLMPRDSLTCAHAWMASTCYKCSLAV